MKLWLVAKFKVSFEALTWETANLFSEVGPVRARLTIPFAPACIKTGVVWVDSTPSTLTLI